MPWCEECDELITDDELTDDGACPTCGTPLIDAERRPIPWYFKSLIVATVIYLGYRSYQGIGWVVHHV